jgi:hypothetical protein
MGWDSSLSVETRFYEFNVWTDRKRIEKLKYIHRNPVRRGLVAKADEWILEQLPVLRVPRTRHGSDQRARFSKTEIARLVRPAHAFAKTRKNGAPRRFRVAFAPRNDKVVEGLAIHPYPLGRCALESTSAILVPEASNGNLERVIN